MAVFIHLQAELSAQLFREIWILIISKGINVSTFLRHKWSSDTQSYLEIYKIGQFIRIPIELSDTILERRAD